MLPSFATDVAGKIGEPRNYFLLRSVSTRKWGRVRPSTFVQRLKILVIAEAMMSTFWHDLRYGLRLLLKNPGFAGAAIVCLALGIGATTAIFSVVNAVLLRPLPYAQPERLIKVYSEFPNQPSGRKFWVSPPEYIDLKRDTKSWESLDAWVNGGVNLGGSVEPVRVTGAYITGGLLGSLGVTPIRGRVITQEDD